MIRVLFNAAAVILPVVWIAEAQAVESIDFIRDIQPILQQHCLECHGPDEQNGGLRFDAPPSAFAEADSGERAIVAGDAQASELLARVTATDEGIRMPPEGEPLGESQVALLRNWIMAGAPWPRHDAAADAHETTETHWAYQPLSPSTPPAVADESWPQSDWDRFIQAKREAAGLQPVRDADPVTLIRRATYDLTGLPPRPEEVTAFVAAAESPSGLEHAFSQLVDRLLARATYGERWGRHWMDWVRYADTAGDNSDFPIPQAYLYRNYIIDSFNADLPYDRFLTEQLAGDLLPADSLEERNRQTIATGYLAMARRFGSLVERYPWHLTIEDTIDNVGRTMMGLTISCARCHDHKFDPISTRDYYALYGIFASTRYPFPGIELFQTQKDLVPLIPQPEVTAARKPFQAETDKLSAQLEKLLAECRQQAIENAAREPQASLDEQRKMRDELDAMLLKARRAGEALAKHLKNVPTIPAAYAVQEGAPQNASIQIKGDPHRPGAEVPRRFLEVLGGDRLPNELAPSESGRLQLAGWIADAENPLTPRVIVNRVWQRHFGEGLVASTSDFGARGESPTHPALLDWLADEFIRGGWSIKHLHRLIMNSHTYRLSSQSSKAALTSDPDNRLYWKFNRRRLDAESIRDTLLMISGTLDPTPQTEPYPIPPASEWKYTQHHPFKDQFTSNKRSVYLMTKRLTAQPYFQTFDGPDPNVCTSDRDQSVTPLQALYFVNDEFLHERAAEFSQQIREASNDDRQRIERAVKTILARPPTAEETALMFNHIKQAKAQQTGDPQAEPQAWASLIRSLLRLNEFIYID